jgi:fructose-bisphosphate aldolase, class I
MRSTINLPLQDGIAAVVKQQFEVAAQIAAYGLMPIIEPEVSIKSPNKAEAEAILHAEILKQLGALSDGKQVMLKLTIPTVPNFYRELTQHESVARVVALSGGYPRTEACRHLAANHGMIASFSRALIEGLQHSMSDTDFDFALANSIAEIDQASTKKV